MSRVKRGLLDDRIDALGADGVIAEAETEAVMGASDYLRYDALHAARKTLIGLRFDEGRWIGEPGCYFRPHGLLVAGAPRGCWLKEWSVGSQRQFPRGPDPIALDTFILLEMLGERSAAARPFHYTVSPGDKCVLTITKADGSPLGPPASFTLWGICADL